MNSSCLGMALGVTSWFSLWFLILAVLKVVSFLTTQFAP